MSARDWYEEFLLGEVRPLCPAGFAVWTERGQWVAAGNGDEHHAPTLADALAALYRDLTGTEPPPRPTEEEVREVVDQIRETCATPLGAIESLRFLNHHEIRDRLMARAVVEMPMGGGS